jgi:hypothetical protein
VFSQLNSKVLANGRMQGATQQQDEQQQGRARPPQTPTAADNMAIQQTSHFGA